MSALRIIGGDKGGVIIHAPANLPVRPTTDRAKESLFNILHNHFDLENITAIDLFSGTGNMAYEFASRGAMHVVSVDLNFNCYNFIKQTKSKLGLGQMEVVKADVFKYLQKCETTFDIIFADAPYDLPRIPEIANIVFDKNLLNPGGWLIVEHGSELDLSKHPRIKEMRKYGQSTFSIFF